MSLTEVMHYGEQTTLANCAEPPSRQASRLNRQIDAGAPVSRPCGRESLTQLPSVSAS